MSKKLLLTLFTITIVFLYITPVYAGENEPIITSPAYIVMDAKTGDVLYGKNIHQKVYPASTTKIMTIMLALKYGNIQDTVTITDNDIHSLEEGASTIFLEPGEELSLNDALYAAGIPSANDACNGIAHTVSSSYEEFIELMNDEAQAVGANDTHFTNPHGLHNDDHYTTPYDLALIMKEGLTIEGFTNYLSLSYYEIPETNMNQARSLTAHNQLLIENSGYYLEGIQASKTGYTEEAQFTLISYVVRGDKELIVAVFDLPSSEAYYQDTISLTDYIYNNYDYISAKQIPIQITDVELPEKYHFYSKNYYSFKTPESILINEDLENYPVTAMVTFDQFSTGALKEDIIGRLQYIQNNQVIHTENVYLNSNIFRFDFLDLIMWFLFFILVLCLLFIIGAFGLRQHIRRKRRKQRLANKRNKQYY